MTTIIRSTFGAPRPPEPTSDDWRPVETIGEAAGYLVGLTRADRDTGPVIRVVIGLTAGTTIETVALYSDEPENEIDARTCAFAVLRTLEIVEGRGEPEPA